MIFPMLAHFLDAVSQALAAAQGRDDRSIPLLVYQQVKESPQFLDVGESMALLLLKLPSWTSHSDWKWSADKLSVNCSGKPSQLVSPMIRAVVCSMDGEEKL